jgi:hypothetical protein
LTSDTIVTRHIISGGDDRIRTCEGLLTLNGLANRRLQPLGHISVESAKTNSIRERQIVKEVQISHAFGVKSIDTRQENRVLCIAK